MRSTTEYTQGIFTPRNPSKYRGAYPIIYRSRPEGVLMEWFDRNDFIVEWTSESVVIPYLKPTTNKIARYFVDFSVTFKESNGNTIKYLIEYKPKKFTIKPVKSKKMSDSTYFNLCQTHMINEAKWKAAKEYAERKNMKFLVITEQHLGISNENKRKKSK